MLKALVSTRLRLMFSSMFRTTRNSKKRGIGFKILIGIFAVYVLGVFMFMFAALFMSICTPLCDGGLSWFYFALVGLIALVVQFVGSVFSTQTQLFEARDNEMLLSLPIPPRLILASRIGVLLAMNLVFELFIVIPGGVVYSLTQPVTAGGVVFFMLGSLLLPFMAMALSCLFGWLVAVLSARAARFKSVITLLLSAGFFVLYFYLFSQLQEYIAGLIVHGTQIAEVFRTWLFPFYHFGTAISSQSILSFLLFALCALVPFAIVYLVLSRFFISIVTANRGVKKARYREKALHMGGVQKAFIVKELRHFAARPMYMINAGIGVVMMLLFSGAMLFNKDIVFMLFEQASGMEQWIVPLCTAIIGFCVATVTISAPSVSLEGKGLWVAQSMPSDPSVPVLAKAWAHVIVSLPATVLSSALCAAALRPDGLSTAALLLMPAALAVLIAFVGVTANLRFPKFDWINETAAVKQGASVLITMLCGFCLLAVPAMLYFLMLAPLLSLEWFMLICAAVYAGASGILYLHLKKKGGAVFASL